jgi:hypothetical protein
MGDDSYDDHGAPHENGSGNSTRDSGRRIMNSKSIGSSSAGSANDHRLQGRAGYADNAPSPRPDRCHEAPAAYHLRHFEGSGERGRLSIILLQPKAGTVSAYSIAEFVLWK